MNPARDATISNGDANNLGNIKMGGHKSIKQPPSPKNPQNKRAQSTIKQLASMYKGGEQSTSKGAHNK